MRFKIHGGKKHEHKKNELTNREDHVLEVAAPQLILWVQAQLDMVKKQHRNGQGIIDRDKIQTRVALVHTSQYQPIMQQGEAKGDQQCTIAIVGALVSGAFSKKQYPNT